MNRFAWGIGWRMALLGLLAGTMVYIGPASRFMPLLIVTSLLLLMVAVNLYQYVTGVNRKLTYFLESVRYSDFAISFNADSKLGPSFAQLNQQFNEVLEAFRQARAEKEANLQYLNTIVQHVSVGLLAFDAAGQVELVNQAALRLLDTYRLRLLTDLADQYPDLPARLTGPDRQAAFAYTTASGNDLAIRTTDVRLRGRLVTLVSLQNIRSELQQKEVDAWQNLTKVLRHEIMNSVTPLVSLTGTMQAILEHDIVANLPPLDTTPGSAPPTLPNAAIVHEAVTDLGDALNTIAQRGEGIMRFVDAYRNFTTIPAPRVSSISVQTLMQRVAGLVRSEFEGRRIAITVVQPDAPLTVLADEAQVEMILLNLLKNAGEALEKTVNPSIRFEALLDGTRSVIEVADNGPGIEPEALDQIFIPFFTTKKTGSGIGLSLSRQMMQQMGGQLTVSTEVGKGSIFRLLF
ncbi:sensor histidine kinase [Fibrivirga algicola]|uniref:histidine kinase n=1 Tax=Fibrivirga algicola TaxID=2950420 RepID=A0ABX0QLM2_9BACT|nr:ATP-binding protein [Fibrivirga algicola]ARK11431.1 histidine kinase [Fibrella sp. ES10-3-2-2]NID12713.1 PAS domain-containing protein [Fibrivirga algicola]